MVIGNGLIANAFMQFREDDRYLFFCSGVSNSLCRDLAAFEREKNMLQEHIRLNPGKTLVYFSTTSIYDPSLSGSMYVLHKQAMEQLIAAECSSWYIFRLSNVVGKSSNKFTVLNFFYNAIAESQPFDLWRNSTRNLIDVDDVTLIVKEILQNDMLQCSIINIANSYSYEAPYIVMHLEQHLGKKANYNIIDKGMGFITPIPDISSLLNGLNINFGDNYLDQLLEKYYPI